MRLAAQVGLVTALSAFALMVIAQTGQPQREIFVPSNDVSFTIATDQDTYRTGRVITVKYRIVNVSNHAVFVPRNQFSATCPPQAHVWAWFENRVGRHFIPGIAGDCSPAPQSVLERMSKEAALLNPGQHLDGTITLNTHVFSGIVPGTYRIEAVLYGWKDQNFDPAEQKELAKLNAPFVRGEVPASTSVKLMP